MNKVITYIAATLDGYIARPSGDISWLDPYQNRGEDYGYGDFLDSVGTLIVGSTSYKQMLTFGEWPYVDKKTYVLSDRELERAQDADIEFYAEDLSQLIDRTKSRATKISGSWAADKRFQVL